MTPVDGFDRKDKDSPFLSFVAREFRGRGTLRRKQLASKEEAAKAVDAVGMRAPKKYKVFADIDKLRWYHLRKRVVLKYARGWSARGVMLLEPLGGGRYFDYMSLKSYSLKSIKAHQLKVAESFGAKEDSWILEEFLRPAHTPGNIPFDYKFYVFGQQIGAILQFDRNSSPPRMTLFDGAFNPMREGVDYVLCSPRTQRGVPVVPPNAAQLQWWAMKLASLTDAPFVSIDLYDTTLGPVFGEFTFSPGATHKRMLKFSHETLDHFDTLFSAAEKHLAAGWEGKGDYPDTPQCQYLTELRAHDIKEIVSLPAIDKETYYVCSGVAYNQGSRGARRLAEHCAHLSAGKSTGLQALVFGRLEKAWSAIAKVLERRAQEGKAPQ